MLRYGNSEGTRWSHRVHTGSYFSYSKIRSVQALGGTQEFQMQSNDASRLQCNLLSRKTVNAMGIFFSTPLTVSWNRQCSREGMLASIRGSFPSPIQLISHHLLAALLLAELEVSKCYLGQIYNVSVSNQ